MENSRENTIVIFAGYTNEMERFLQRNPGLRSRIAFHIPFDDYTTPELCSITNLIAEKNGMKIAGEATPRLEKSLISQGRGLISATAVMHAMLSKRHR